MTSRYLAKLMQNSCYVPTQRNIWADGHFELVAMKNYAGICNNGL